MGAPVLSYPNWLDPEHTDPHERPFWDVLARLRPGVLWAAAQGEVSSIWGGRRSQGPTITRMSFGLCLSESISPARTGFQTWLLSLFSAVALGLAALGVFAVMHYLVSARINEIGIRMAVGANRADIVRLILSNGTALAASGIAVGTFATMWLTRLISGMLFSVTPGQPG